MSLLIVALLTFALVFGSIYAGFWLYRLASRNSSNGVIEPSGTAVGALMGLLAFMLAFAFSMGANRLDVRKQALLQEINAIGTLNLRTAVLPAAEGEAYRQLIKEYVQLRIDLRSNPTILEDVIARADAICNEFWTRSMAFADSNRADVTALALIEATNDVIDAYEERVFQGTQHMPIIIWAALISMSALAMIAMGYQLGMSGKMSHLVNILMALTFAGALMMIADLDRYDEGFFMLPDAPMERLYASLNT